MVRIEVVAAVRSEEAALPGFVTALRALPLPDGVQLEMLFVEDSSDDRTRPILRSLSKADPGIRYWSLEEGFGQGPAIVFGLARSTADAVIMMDVDGGHPIDAIPGMLDHFLSGAKVVQCRRRSLPGRPAYRTLGSATFRAGARLLTGVDFETQSIYYRLIAADVVPLLVNHPQYWPLLRFPLPDERDGSLVVIEVDAEDRVLGETKYDPIRLAALAADGVLSLIRGSRLALLVGIAAGAALALILSGSWLIALVLAIGVGLTVRRSIALRSDDALSKMRVAESSEPDRG